MVDAADQLHVEPVAGPSLPPFVVEADQVTLLGRAQECTVCLTDPSVSREHASIRRRGGQWFITDLGSRHGSQLNGISLRPDEPALLEPGDLLRLGPYTLRLRAESPSRMMAAADSPSTGTLVERVPQGELESIVQKRLQLLMDGAASIHAAADEDELARAILDVALAGSGYSRGAVLRHTGASDEVEVLASSDTDKEELRDFTFSRSLILEVAAGHVARLSEDAPVPLGQSITRLAIHSALCAPILLDASVVGSIYLDSRADERPGFDDASSFCHAVSRFASLALAGLKRVELSQRQERLDVDLGAARNAQAFLLPPEKGSVGHLNYSLQSFPGRVVAGDLFDIFALDENRVAVCCGDVSGQGMGAAIVMTAILSHLRAAIGRFHDPASVVGEVNEFIAPRSPENMFASLWVGVFDAANGVLKYVDAGHGHWLVRPKGEAPRKPVGATGLLVGIEPSFQYETATYELSPGDRVVLYSDGVVEHRSTAGEEFGSQRIIDVVAESEEAQTDVDRVFSALREFIEGRSLVDDTTIASIEVGG